MSGVLSLKSSYYEALKRLTLELAGVHLGDDHAFLVETRLGALARQEGYQNLNQLVDDLFGNGQTRLAIKVVSSLLERDTHFNPDPEGMDVFETVILPRFIADEKTDIKILSFACSSGQEPYSLAMKVDKFCKSNKDFKASILGVDYPSPALNRAKAGRYTHFEAQRGLPVRDLIAYFDRQGEDWIVKEELKQIVRFKEFHLLSKLDGLGSFDLVMFRNSLTHYSSPAQIRVVRSLSAVVKPEGYLMFGSGEPVPNTRNTFGPLEEYPYILQKISEVIPEDLEEAQPEVPSIPPREYVPGQLSDQQSAERA